MSSVHMLTILSTVSSDGSVRTIGHAFASHAAAMAYYDAFSDDFDYEERRECGYTLPIPASSVNGRIAKWQSVDPSRR